MIIACEGAKNNIRDDEELKKSDKSITKILTDLISKYVSNGNNKDMKDNLNYKLFNIDILLNTDVEVSSIDISLCEKYSRYALELLVSSKN